jgi:hypothetical protein
MKQWLETSNGYSLANLASASTHQKISIFGEYLHSPKWPFSKKLRDLPDLLTFANAIFEKNVTRFAKFARVLLKSGKLCACNHCFG